MPSLRPLCERNPLSSCLGLTFPIEPSMFCHYVRPPLPATYPPSNSVPGIVPETPQVKVVTSKKAKAVLRYMTEIQAKSAANTNTDNFQHSACLASPEGNRTWPSWAHAMQDTNMWECELYPAFPHPGNLHPASCWPFSCL